MKIILDIKDSKVPFIMELLKSFSFVKIEKVTGDSKKEIINNLTQGFNDLKLYKQGELKTTSAQDFLNDL